MDRGHYMLFAILGMLTSLAFFLPLGAKRRVRVPSYVWWVLIAVGVVANFFGMSHSVAPSSARRITAIGKLYNHVEARRGRDTHYGYDFLPNGEDKPIHLETSIIIPGWGNEEGLEQSTFKVIYLDSTARSLSNELIAVEILAGPHEGFHDFMDARFFGRWLTIPIGVFIASFGYFGLKYKKDDEKKSWGDADEDQPEQKNPLDIDLFR